MGRERFFEGTRDYFRIYHNNPDHPVVQDFVAVMRRHADDKAAFDEFARQWFFGIVMPEYQLSDAKKEQRGEEWEVTVRVKNAGTGRMPVEIAATAGWRWGEDGKVSPDYKDARVKLVLGAGEEKVARIRCSFMPEAVVVDPDANVLQLQRQAAAARL
jgi:ABC-2 type transport system permease protein